MKKNKKIVAITGPSCAGKTTLGNYLKENDGYKIIKQITTRKRRKSDNIDEIVCISHEEFKNLKDNNEFYIWSGDSDEIKEENGNFYGILKEDVEGMHGEEKLIMFVSYKDIKQLASKKEDNIKIVNLKIYDFDRIMSARMYGNDDRSDMHIDEYNRRLKCAKEYEMTYGQITEQYANIIVTDNLTPEEVWQKAKKIIG